MYDDDEFQRSIPAFLRRAAEPWPDEPMFMTVGTKPAPPAADPPAEVVDLRPRAQAPAANGPAGDGDAPFQVTLPRGIVRQIETRAAEEGTTRRAVVLRALRAAGFAVPADADADRGAPAAEVRQQA
jgi:hypothetical protein